MEQENQLDKSLKRDLILREFLAIERTKMANYRTFLAFSRTGLYFVVAGSTLGQITDSSFWKYMGLPSIIVGAVIIVVGVIVYLRSKRKLVETRGQVGKIKDDFILSIMGEKD